MLQELIGHCTAVYLNNRQTALALEQHLSQYGYQQPPGIQIEPEQPEALAVDDEGERRWYWQLLQWFNNQSRPVAKPIAATAACAQSCTAKHEMSTSLTEWNGKLQLCNNNTVVEHMQASALTYK